MSRPVALLLVVALAALSAPGCVIPFGTPTRTVDALRISEAVGEGDAQQRASTRIVLSGLRADAAGDAERALGRYEEALRVDANNPYAYLALARHHAGGVEPGRALSYLDKAGSLFRANGGPSPRVQPHLDGLRGQALYGSGEVEDGLVLLERAWSVAPDVWTDGQLSAEELE